LTFKSKEQKQKDKEKNKDTHISTTVQHLKLSKLGKDVILDILTHANSLYNCMTYSLRQGFVIYKTLNFQSIAIDLQEDFKQNYHYQMLYSQAAQSVAHKVAENFKSFKELLDKHYQQGEKKPKLPGYREKGGLFEVTYPSQAVKITREKGKLFAAVSTGVTFRKRHKDDVMGTKLNEYLKFRVPNFVDTSKLVELTITSKHGEPVAVDGFPGISKLANPKGEIYLHWVCRKQNQSIPSLDVKKVLGIDIGLNNFVTCIPNTGEQGFIINGRQLKSINRLYNKSVSNLKKGKEQGFWNNNLARVTQKRNNQVRDFIKKSARIIINKCLESGIGKIVFGWNEGIKNEIDHGRVNNQNFVQVPFTALKDTLEYLCKRYGIEFVVVEESYTSKMSFFDGDELPVYGEPLAVDGFPGISKVANPKGQESDEQKQLKSSGTRTKRGTYVTKNKTVINADANGASNILRKAKVDTSKITYRVCQVLEKINVWVEKYTKRKNTTTRMSGSTVIGLTEPSQ
jgi:putative transposase